MSSIIRQTLIAFLHAMAMLAALAGTYLWSGYVLSILWGWFVAPFGLPPIGIAWAVGLICTAYFLRGWHRWPPHADVVEDWKDIGFYYAIPAFALLIGWIAKEYM